MKRIEDLDVVRGFALCGIHAVNIYQQVILPKLYPEGIGYGLAEMPDLVRYGLYERFLPIFTLLFGISFGIFLMRAGARTDRPRIVLARRLLALGVVGAVHQIVHPGEVLLVYAVMGLVFLLPASFLGGVAACVSGVVVMLIGGQFIPGYGVMPGLLVLGFGLALLRVPEGLARHAGRVSIAFACFALVALMYAWTSYEGIALPSLSLGWTSLTAQLVAVCTGLAYATGMVLLLRTPFGPALQVALAPMGRMALTNYLMATVLLLTLAPVLGIDDLSDTAMVAVLTVGIVVVEAIWSWLWLARFRYGPAEWGWRCLTWRERVPMRRGRPVDGVGRGQKGGGSSVSSARNVAGEAGEAGVPGEPL
ncbi:hypothetical protein GCM10023169_18530 [Georgenia halophila]|uniref:DUF418 domain-containing protein n=2 Tax=Georgenia halophila TaxID=620889 RepID=A0ABP8L6L5_9MICO